MDGRFFHFGDEVEDVPAVLAFAEAVPDVLAETHPELRWVAAFVDGARAVQAVGTALELLDEAVVRQHLFHGEAILARADALILLFLAGTLATGFVAFSFAQRAFWAVAIFARPAALILPFFLGALADTGAEAPRIEDSSLFKASIFSFRSAARRS